MVLGLAALSLAVTLACVGVVTALRVPSSRGSFLTVRSGRGGSWNAEPDTGKSSASMMISAVPDPDELRKWFTLQFKRRAEVALSDASSVGLIVTDIWKSILVSVRVMEKDPMMPEFVSIVAFTKYPLDSQTADRELKRLQDIVASINVDQSSLLFQPDFHRTLSVILKPPLGENSACLVVLVDTKRKVPKMADFDDIDDFVPTVDDAVNNNIESFPFPTVFDFISEVNRPPDPLTLSQLTFNYKVTDFKYDLAKMAKKKSPQDVLKSINCKLTRLQKWKEVLQQPSKNDLPDPFVEAAVWGEAVKRKYQSLKALAKTDTKAALDTQYDKRATFINIIDEWSERLKRSFKFTYFAKRSPPQDFQKAFMDSQWRNEMRNTTRVFAETPFLDYGGPTFRPGYPEPIFRDDRYLMYDSFYRVELVMYEMLAWFKSIDSAHRISSVAPFGATVQHTYSRGLITERVMFDVWQGLIPWLTESNGKSPRLSAAKLTTQLTATRPLPDADLDHTDSFFATLRGVSALAREESMAKSTSIKGLFKQLYTEGNLLTEWWTTLVRDLDLSESLEAIARDRKAPWSEIADNVIAEEGLKDGWGAQGDMDAAAAAKAAEQNAEIWTSSYRSTLRFAEKIRARLPWTHQLEEAPSEAALASFADEVNVKLETVTLAFEKELEADQSFLFVAPRFFRGIGMEQELVSLLKPYKCIFPAN